MTTNNDEMRERGRMTKGEWDIMEGKTLLHVETRHDNPVGAGIHICSLPKASGANARAIAALPELVEALQASLKEHRAVLGFLNVRSERGELLSAWTETTQDQIQVAEAALKKAGVV